MSFYMRYCLSNSFRFLFLFLFFELDFVCYEYIVLINFKRTSCKPPSSGWFPKIWERDLLLEAKRSRRTRIDDLERLINKPDTSAYLSYYVATPPRCETKSKMRDRRGKYCNLNSTNPDSSRVREAFIF